MQNIAYCLYNILKDPGVHQVFAEMVRELRNTNPYCPSRMWVASIALLKTFTNEMFFGLELTLNCSDRIQRPTS